MQYLHRFVSQPFVNHGGLHDAPKQEKFLPATVSTLQFMKIVIAVVRASLLHSFGVKKNSEAYTEDTFKSV